MDLINICEKIFEFKYEFGDELSFIDKNWVLYENGTVIYSSRVDIDDKKKLIKFSNDLVENPVIAGTPCADFDIIRLDKLFPDEPIYIIMYEEPENILSIIIDEPVETKQFLLTIEE